MWVAEQFALTRRASIHLRGLHYAIVARGGVLKPNGEVYVNDDDNWMWLQATRSRPRVARLCPVHRDHRRAQRRAGHPSQGMFEPETWVSVGLNVDIPDADDLRPTAGCDDFVGASPTAWSIIGEKSSLGRSSCRLRRSFQADLYLPTGEISDTLIYQIASDAAADGRPLRVFYLSDFDPAGYEMPANVAASCRRCAICSSPISTSRSARSR